MFRYLNLILSWGVLLQVTSIDTKAEDTNKFTLSFFDSPTPMSAYLERSDHWGSLPSSQESVPAGKDVLGRIASFLGLASTQASEKQALRALSSPLSDSNVQISTNETSSLLSSVPTSFPPTGEAVSFSTDAVIEPPNGGFLAGLPGIEGPSFANSAAFADKSPLATLESYSTEDSENSSSFMQDTFAPLSFSYSMKAVLSESGLDRPITEASTVKTIASPSFSTSSSSLLVQPGSKLTNNSFNSAPLLDALKSLSFSKNPSIEPKSDGISELGPDRASIGDLELAAKKAGEKSRKPKDQVSKSDKDKTEKEKKCEDVNAGITALTSGEKINDGCNEDTSFAEAVRSRRDELVKLQNTSCPNHLIQDPNGAGPAIKMSGLYSATPSVCAESGGLPAAEVTWIRSLNENPDTARSLASGVDCNEQPGNPTCCLDRAKQISRIHEYASHIRDFCKGYKQVVDESTESIH